VIAAATFVIVFLLVVEIIISQTDGALESDR